jgi:hypothetical protein
MTESFILPFLESAFSKDFTFTDYVKQKLDFYVHDMGKLKVTDGKIIACDPFLYNEDPAFDATFPIGEFPVQLAIAKIKDDERVAFARINFSEQQTPVSWQMAIIPGQDLSTLKKGEIFGYPVDAGTAAFMDATAGRALGDLINEDNGDGLADEMEKNYKNTWSSLLKKQDDHTLALFSSGWGDGFYATYIGTDANGNICRLVTDFSVIFEEEK